MKIGVIGDIHLQVQDPYSNIDASTGFSIRTLDKFKSIKKALEISKEQKIDLFIFNGDIFDKLNPNEKLKSWFYSILNPYYQYFDIVLFPGNHDGIQVSHSYMTEKVIMDQIGFEQLVIIDRITLLEKYENELLLIPWTTDLEAINQSLIDYGDSNCICVGHLEIDGAVSSTEHVLNLGLKPQRFSKFQTVLLNHYHKYQQCGKNIWYVGSSNIKDFSEASLPKGFVIYDSHKKNHEFYQLEDRLFYEFLISEESLEEVDNFLNNHSIEQSIVKLRIEGLKSWISEVKSEILEIFKELKPLKIITKYSTLKEQNTRITQIQSKTNRYEKIKSYANGNEEYITYGIKQFQKAENIFKAIEL